MLYRRVEERRFRQALRPARLLRAFALSIPLMDLICGPAARAFAQSICSEHFAHGFSNTIMYSKRLSPVTQLVLGEGMKAPAIIMVN